MGPDRRAVSCVLLILFVTLAVMADSCPAAAQLDRLRKSLKDAESAQPEQAPMGMIPAGAFWMGVDGLQGLDDERPRHAVLLHAYAMDLYEVTVGRYAVFLRQTARTPPLFWDTVDLNEHADRPVIGVD
jgi:formylglycine-generating enzyme required for sulfatase activity